jgi:hypothetical protein
MSFFVLKIPPTIVSGDTVTWIESLPAYPPDLGWVFEYVLQGETPITLTGITENNAYKFTIDTVLDPGLYYWQAQLTKDGSRNTLSSGRLQVSIDLNTAIDYDGRSQAEKELEEVRKAIDTIYKGGQSYKIKDREFTRGDLTALIARESQLKAQVWRESQANLGKSPNMKVRFR